ncbi:MAG: hypothetical protein QGI24_06430 [Kiritimatiellia bacterium]|jgi:hypothetical protein|nr:hypothetical protein [Kiritimatiellia bacterium]MDP6848407.1 hypothetical protein [Kiritimatiellia bacterium]
MNQLLLGALIGFMPMAALYAWRRFRSNSAMLIAAPLAVITCSVWAVIPDIPRLLDMTNFYLKLSRDPRTNLFFWHYTIDQMEVDSPWYAAGIVLLYASMLFAAWRELKMVEDR